VRRFFKSHYLWCAFFCFGTVPDASADEKADEEIFAKVMSRLLASDLAAREYPSKYTWPPQYKIMPKSEKMINAFATASPLMGATVDEKSKKIHPMVMATRGLLHEVIKGDENSLAVIMGHELAHLSKDHVGKMREDTPLVALAFNRDQEIEADLDGLRYAVAAGYPYRTGVASAYGAMRKLDRGATSFEGLSQTHPTWEDRLVYLDRNQAKLWSAMSAFQNGFLFSNLEQYLAAQQCFKAVVAEFPECYEGWANLGNSLLMQYCDSLDADDLRSYGLGPIAAVGFYARPESLEAKVRGIDEKLWKEAVRALDKAVALKADQTLPRASLGLAYLLHPDGKQVKKATQYFKEALEGMDKDPEMKKNPAAKASVLVNAAVADSARGDQEAARAKLKTVDSLLKTNRISFAVEDAYLANSALLETKSPNQDAKDKACKIWETYLKNVGPDSAWWPIACDHYDKLAKEAKHTALPRDQLKQAAGPTLLRLVVSISIGTKVITLSEPAKEAVARLGKDPVAQPLFPGSKIMRWHSADSGIDVLAKDKVLAIFLTSAKAPPVSVRAIGVGSKARELRVGMAEKEAKEILKDQRAEKGTRSIADTKTEFHFYPALGLGIRFASDKIEELAIAQIPRRSFFGN
jgi:tetratricopeptide (TPR) repeat protein